MGVILKVKRWETDFISEARNWTRAARSGWADIQSTFISFCFLEVFSCSCNFVKFVLDLRFSSYSKLFSFLAFFCRSERLLSKWRISVELTDFCRNFVSKWRVVVTCRSDLSKWRVVVTNLCQSDGCFAARGTRNRELFLLFFHNTINNI